VVLKPRRDHPILEGHPWVFTGAVARHPTGVEPGGIVGVRASDGLFIGKGYYNPESSIPVRILTVDPDEEIDRPFLQRRIERAMALRRDHFDPEVTSAYRLVHGETDALPGLIVDRYADYLVVQFHTMGMDRLKAMVVDVLERVGGAKGIFERSDVGTRRAEGFEVFPVGVLSGDEPPERIEFVENGVRFWVDVSKGQKTGFFLDQRDNRLELERHCKDSDVLNLFSFSGGFSVYAAQGGARSAVSVDISEPAVAMARANLELNGFDPATHPCIAANCFDYLKESRAAGRMFDVVVVDPPAFVSNREALDKALKSYISLNRRAIDLVRPGGILVTSSCSTQVDYDQFYRVVKHAATAARREVHLFKSHLMSIDHPASSRFPEGRYLKCLFGVVR